MHYSQSRTQTHPHQLRTVATRCAHSSSVGFKKRCRSCSLASRCTTAKAGRKLTLTSYEPLLRAARTQARDPDWQAEYRRHRPMVERSIAWLTRGNRKVRYRGAIKNDHWLHHRAAALNLRRLIAMGLTSTGNTWAIA
ncbi:transposase [Mycobacterium paraffinicum]|nr:transposase [Mycobacterium paraffinicum]